MKIPKFVPAPAEIGREALVVMGGALLAALIIGNLPDVKAWIKAQWGNTPQSLP